MPFPRIVFQMGVCLVAGLLLSACSIGEKVTSDASALREYSRREEQGIVQVGGCVHHPVIFFLKPGEKIKLSEAIKRAGGTIEGDYFAGQREANGKDIRVFRRVKDMILDYKLDILPTDDGGNFMIKAGDAIYVPEIVL